MDHVSSIFYYSSVVAKKMWTAAPGCFCRLLCRCAVSSTVASPWLPPIFIMNHFIWARLFLASLLLSNHSALTTFFFQVPKFENCHCQTLYIYFICFFFNTWVEASRCEILLFAIKWHFTEWLQMEWKKWPNLRGFNSTSDHSTWTPVSSWTGGIYWENTRDFWQVWGINRVWWIWIVSKISLTGKKKKI